MIVLSARSHLSGQAKDTVSEPWLDCLRDVPRIAIEEKKGNVKKPEADQPIVPAMQTEGGADDLLNDDVLLEVLDRLDSCNRHAVYSSCRRLRSLAQGTFRQISMAVPTASAACNKAAAHMGARIATVAGIQLQLPQHCGSGVDQDPTAAFDTFLSGVLPAGCILPLVETLLIRAYGNDSATCQLSRAALARLASSAPRLTRLALPLISPAAASALPLLPLTVSMLSLTVCDSPSLDHVVQLPSLSHLSVSTREGLLYLVLSQNQVADLAQISGLRSLALNNVFLSDCRVTFDPLSMMTALTELRVSSPLSADRLFQLPASLRVLQLPFFANGLEPAAGLGASFGLVELRCKQALTEYDLLALSHMQSLATLQCDNLVLSDAKVALVQAALVLATATGYDMPPAPLPLLAAVRTVKLTGYHKYNGLLGLLFPNLERLKVASVEVPHPRDPPHTAALPHVQHLSLPSCKVLPAVLAGCPSLRCLSVSGINCLQRLEELLHLTLPLPHPAASGFVPAAGDSRAATTGALWWPPELTDLTLGFSSSLRFRPKQIAAALDAAPACITSRVRALTICDRGREAPPDSTGRVVDDSVLAAAVGAMVAITELRLLDCGALTSSGLLQAVEAARPVTRLAVVRVAGCPRVSRQRSESIPSELGRPWLDVQWCEHSRL